MRNNERHTAVGGWTLSETLVTMIVAGVVFLAVMDGLTLFTRYARAKTGEIAENTLLYDGYYRLAHLAAAADSASFSNGVVELYRGETTVATLAESDSAIIAQTMSMTDTLMRRAAGLRLETAGTRTGTDSLKVTVREPGGNMLGLSFPVRRPAGKIITETLQEQEKPYRYE